LEIAGKLTGVIVFVVGIILLGVVFRYTVSTIGDAETAVRPGHLMMAPLFGGQDAPMAPARRAPRAATRERTAESEAGRAPASESPPDALETEDEELSPLVRFGMIVGARIVGLCALGFLAGVIATQGARMCGAFAPPSRREQ